MKHNLLRRKRVKLTKSQLKELVKHAIVDVMSEDDSDKYTHIGYGKYKEKGKEKDTYFYSLIIRYINIH